MKKLFTILALVISFYTMNYAQITLSIPDTAYFHSSDTLIVPLKVTNFNNIGAISLKIQYDTSAVIFDSTTSISQGTFLSNATKGIITIGWYDLNPLNTGDGTLLNLVFTNFKDSTQLKFMTAYCEITDEGGTTLTIDYKNGSITKGVLPASLGGTVWYDENGNGLNDSGEKGVAGVTVGLWSALNGNILNSALTDSAGHFSFAGLQPGGYFIKYILEGSNQNYKFTAAGTGSDSTINSHAVSINDTTASTDTLMLAAGEVYDFANAGLELKVPVSVEAQGTGNVPSKYVLGQNYPNPFNPTTTITYAIPKSGYVTLRVYDALGNEVAALASGYRSAGRYSVTFDMNTAGRNLSSGVYLYRLTAAGYVMTKKMMLLK